MALERVGVQLRADGAAEYIRQLNQAAGATRGISPAADEAGRALNALNVRGVAVGVMLGNLASQAVSKMVSGFINLGREGLAAVSGFEQLKLSVESLSAKEARTADSTLSMADALAQAGPRAEELMAWIERLAIASPFSSEDVSAAFQQAQVYGFAASEAQVLTQSILNFAAATGKSGAVMNQVAYALGQIRNNSKVLTLDLRQLSGAGIDVTGVLAAMGKSWADVTAGTVESSAFLETFVQVLNEDFAGAGARAQNTLQGLIASLGDLRTIGLRNLLAPSVTAFEEAFSPLIGTIQNGLLPVVKMAGEYLGDFTRALIENRNMILAATAPIAGLVAGFVVVPLAFSLATTAVAGLTAALTFLLSPIGLVAAAVGVVGLAVGGLAGLFISSFQEIDSKTKSYFGGLTDDLFSFGENIILSLANGMAMAIGAVVGVLTQIGAMIANWLAPGSPPRLLPDIDQWGAGAMNEYLRGFLDADFGIFNTLSGTIEGFLRSLTGSDDVNLIPGLLNARSAIAAAIDQMRQSGTVGESALQGIISSLGVTNPDLEQYIRLMFQSAQASEALKQAQERLNEITQRYSNLLSPLRDELDAIGQEQQRTARQDRRTELQAILEQARAAGNIEAERRALMEMRALDLQDQIALIEVQEEAETSAAQEAVNAAAEQAQAAAEQLAAQRALIDAQTENNRLIQAQIQLLERLAEAGSAAGGGAAAGGGVPTIPGGGLDFGLPDMDEGPFSEALHAFQKRFNDFVRDIKAPFLELSDNLSKMREAWGAAFTGAGNVVISFMEGLKGNTTDAKNVIFQFANEAGLSIRGFVLGLEGEQVKATTAFQKFANDSGLALNGLLLGIRGLKTQGVSDVAEFANQVGFGLRQYVIDLGTSITKTGELAGALVVGLITAGQEVATFLNTVFTTAFNAIGLVVMPFVQTVTEGLANIWRTVLLPAFEAVWGFVQNSLFPLFDALEGVKLAAVSKASEALQIVWDTLLLPALTKVWEFIDTKVLPIFDLLQTTINDKIKPAITDGFFKSLEALNSFIRDVFYATVGRLQDEFLEPLRLGLEGISTAINTVTGWLLQLQTAINQLDLSAIAQLLGNSPSPFEISLGGISRAMQRLSQTEFPALQASMNQTPIHYPASSAQVAGQTVVNNYYNSPTGIQNANINNGMDVAAVEAIALRVISHAMAYS